MPILKAGAASTTFNLDGKEYSKGLYEATYSDVITLADGSSDESKLTIGLRNINTGDTIQESVMIRAWKNGSQTPYTTLDSLVADLNSVAGMGSSGSSPSLEVLTTYPTTDASKAGQQFMYEGQLWRYLTADETSAEPEGSPWPAKGYKQITIKISVNPNTPTDITTSVIKDDFNIAALVPDFTRTGVGAYSSGVFQVGDASSYFGYEGKEVILSSNSNTYSSTAGIYNAFSDRIQLVINSYVNGVGTDGTYSSQNTYTATTKIHLPIT